MIRTLCGDLPCPTEAEIPQMLPYETEIYRNIFISLPFSPKVRETTFGREKDCPCSFAGTPPYIHFWHVSLPTPLHTEYKYSLENSKHSSIHDAVLGGSQQVAVTGGPDSNSRFVCKGATVRGSRRKSSGLGEPQFLSLPGSNQSHLLPSDWQGLSCGVLNRWRRMRQVSRAPGSESCSLQAKRQTADLKRTKPNSMHVYMCWEEE